MKPRKKFEYKVVAFDGHVLNILNREGADGWQYCGGGGLFMREMPLSDPEKCPRNAMKVSTSGSKKYVRAGSVITAHRWFKDGDVGSVHRMVELTNDDIENLSLKLLSSLCAHRKILGVIWIPSVSSTHRAGSSTEARAHRTTLRVTRACSKA